MKRFIIVLSILLCSILILPTIATATNQYAPYKLFLPIVTYPIAPTASPTGIPSEPTPVPPNPTPVPPNPTSVPQRTGNIQVITIHADGAGSAEPDEYVEIKNLDAASIQLLSWTLTDNSAHTYTFPNFFIQPGQTCRVYTNQAHPEYCGFNYANSAAIWNNSGDCAYLKNSSATLIDSYCY